MKKWEYIAGALLVLFTAAMIALALKSLRLTESEKLEQNIDSYEKEIEKIKARRDSANAVPIPMSDAETGSVTKSVNKKYGFDIEVQNDKGTANQIDSILKVLDDYPELLRQSDFYEKQVGDMRTLSELERGELLQMLSLEKWDFKKVKRRIRWYRAHAFIRGAMVGAAAVVTVALLVPK